MESWKAWPKVIGKHGVGNMNSNGLMLLEFCTRFEISVMGTMFQQKDSLKYTWQHLRSKHWHQLDHVLSNQAAKQHIKVTKVNQAADCFTDHKLLVAKCLFSVKPKKKGTKPPKKLDVNMNDDKKEKLEQFLNENLPVGKVDFEDLKQVLQNAATYVFGKKKRVQNDWFDDQDEEIRSLLKDKKHNRNTLRKHIRELKNNWFQQKAEEAERFSQEKNHKEFYATLNAVYGPRSKISHPVRSKDGELLTTPDNIKDRWVEHFSHLLNQPSDVNFSITDYIEQHTIIGSMDSPIEMQELDKALSNTKLGKSPGPDGIIPEVLVHGGNRLRDFLLILFNNFWTTEDIPSDLINPNITIQFKKGDRSMCGNYRGISLLSVVGKLFADIILQRLQQIAEFIYPQSQSG